MTETFDIHAFKTNGVSYATVSDLIPLQYCQVVPIWNKKVRKILVMLIAKRILHVEIFKNPQLKKMRQQRKATSVHTGK